MKKLIILAALFGFAATGAEAQRLSYSRDQPLYPAYEGWREGPDGGYEMIFGYYNENWDQEIDAPIGARNNFAPGPADRGQPTHFLPRRNRFTFSVFLPASFTEQDELVWTIQANGREEKAYGTIREDLYIDNVVIMSETGALGAGSSSPEVRANIPPVIRVEGAMERTARVGEPVELVALVTDDGQPDMSTVRQAAAEAAIASGGRATEGEATPRELLAQALRAPTGTITVSKRVKLYFAWFVYRGTSEGVEFVPDQAKTWEDTRAFANSPWAISWKAPKIPEDGRWISEVTFAEPGDYVLRGRADDGGLYSDVEVTVHVRPVISQ
ncbi:MAG: hypothetical protein PVJ80_02990 [Gemmatimonadota bacterium]|jgi:hypothetical protein